MLDKDALASLKGLKSQMEAEKERVEATIKGTQSRYGFAVLDDGREVFIPPEEMLKVLPGDRARVCVHPGREGKPVADIEKLVTSPLGSFVGTCLTKGKAFFIQPDCGTLTRWLFVPPHARNGAKAGDHVRCAILKHPIKDGKPQAKVLKVLGSDASPGVENQYAIASYGLSDEWPPAVLKEAQASIERGFDTKGRVDLTSLGFVSIDAAKTQDIDDALYAETTPAGWTLYVAIADPSDYLELGSKLDAAIAERATSVYFHGDVVPMMPEALAQQTCALAEGERRPALVLKADINNDGEITSFEFLEAIVQSHGKLSYYAVDRYLSGNNEDPVMHTSAVEALYQLYRVLRERRARVELVMEDRQEFRWVLNDDKQIESIEPYEKLTSQKMVEECMVVANRCAALFLQEYSCSGPFIVHQGFRSDRYEEVSEFLERFAPELSVHALSEVAGYREIMSGLSTAEHELPLRSMVNRLLTRAVLSVASGPHMGMALPVYTNCTSPLRKYADLLVHRQIKSILRKRPITALSQEDLNVIAERIQRAREACIYAERWLVSRYLERITGFKKDCVLDASVAQISSSGLSIRLDGSGLEGFVDLRKDPEKFSFDKWTASLTSTTRRFALGQSIQVFCRGVDSKSRLAQFDVVEGCGLKATKSLSE